MTPSVGNPGVAATVVVVDESAAVLELAEQALREYGYHVLATHDPLEALGVACRVRIDLVVGSAATLNRLRLELSRTQMLEITDADEKAAGPSTLREPFSLAELQSAVARALGAESS